jgi:hypothetical protein
MEPPRFLHYASLKSFNAGTGRAFMIEWAMTFAGGFLVASLLALMLMSVIHRRAVRLTRRRILENLPESLVELQIDKDHQRVHFTMLVRQLEQSVERLRFEASTARAEVGRKAEAIGRLKAEHARKSEAADELALKVESLTNKIEEVECERIEHAIKMFSIESALSAKEAELIRASTEQRLVIHTQSAEIASLNAQIEQYQLAINQLQQHADYTASWPFDAPMADRFWQLSRRIAPSHRP